MSIATFVSPSIATGRDRRRPVSIVGAVFGIFVLAGALAAGTVQASVFVITNTADAGVGSLRQAMLDANAQIVTGGTACAPHQINFAIPGAGPHTIRPLSPLPPVLITITLDGLTQPGAVANSLFIGNNAVLKIELDGSLAGVADGIRLSTTIPGNPGCTASLSLIRGLVINRFQGAGIRAESPCVPPTVCAVGAIRIVGNFIGTDVTGNVGLGNGFGATLQPGILFGPNSVRNIVGDQIPEDGGSSTPFEANRNVISANALDGIYLGSLPGREPALDHRIRFNTIGLNAAGTAMLPNGRHGVFAAAGSNATKVYDNLISGNAGDGIRVSANDSPANLVGNGIGIGENGVAFGNGGSGVYVEGTSKAVTLAQRYAFSPFGMPSIANNGGAGVYVADTAIVDTVATSIAGNAGLALDLAPSGPNANDNMDGDSGPNELLNYPVISGAVFDSGTGTGNISGTLNTTPGVSTSINFYLNDVCGAGGYGGGQNLIRDGQIPVLVQVVPDASGNASFSRTVPFLTPGKFVTAQARRFASAPVVSALIVSEFSACRQVIALTPLIFLDGFE